MSVLFNALDQLEEKQGVSALPWGKAATYANGRFTADLPQETLNDFYDLREYIRIANLRGMMHVLSVTSSVSGEGTSTIAAYLALLMAGVHKKAKVAEKPQVAKMEKSEVTSDGTASEGVFQDEFRAFVREGDEGKKAKPTAAPVVKPGGVLLVDANLYHPTLHQIMQLPQEGGLTDVLERQADWHRFVKTIHDADMNIITAGKSKSHPVGLFGTEAFRQFIKAVKEEYSYVLIDTPAVLNYVDSLSVAAVVDGVILVVRAGQTRWELAQSAKRKLLTAHATLLGVALNRRKVQTADK